MICPYCKKNKCEPAVLYRNCESYGFGRFNFRCLHCKKVITVYAERKVIFGKPEKTSNNSDWGITRRSTGQAGSVIEVNETD